MDESGHESRTERIIRLTGTAAQVAAVVVRVIWELVKFPW